MNKSFIRKCPLSKLLGGVAVSLIALTLPFSCTLEDGENLGAISDIATDEIEFFIEDDMPTRGRYDAAAQVEKYAVYSFYNETKKIHIQDCVMTKQANGTWKKSRIMNFPGKSALDFYALKPSFGDADSYVMTPDEKSFVYTMRNTNAKQKDFMFSSLINKTRESTNNQIKFKMKHLFSYIRFVSKLTNEEIEVEVHSITLHNLLSKGKFTFNRDKERAGDWEIYTTDYDNFKFELPKDSMLTTNKQISLHTGDSLLFLMPQKPDELWDPDVTSKISDADATHQAYVEVACRVWKKRSDADIAAKVAPAADAYIGCSATTWATVYYPLKAGTAWTSKVTPYSGSYNVLITWTGGYTAEGEDFLKKYTNEELEMTSDEPVETFLVTDPWTDDDTNSVTFDM